MKKTTTLLLLAAMLISSVDLSAQLENSRWYFGNNAGMDFMNRTTYPNVTINGVAGQTLTDVPTPIIGPINTWEGCFTLCDRNGNFLFASDGMNVYNGTSSDKIMLNGTGLFGNPSSAQSGVIVPHPGIRDHYFIITSDASDSSGKGYGIRYSEVDLSKTNAQGRGEVIKKNEQMTFLNGYHPREAYEGVAAYPKADETGYWIVNRTRQYFFVWEVTSKGVNMTPVGSYVIGADPGANYHASGNINNGYGLGHTKFSKDGTYIANSAWGIQPIMFWPYFQYGSYLTICRFNNSTGAISGIGTKFLVQSDLSQSYGLIYGIEFSPNADYLYFTCFDKINNSSDIWKIAKADYSTFGWKTVWNNQRRLVNIGLGPDDRMYGIAGNNSGAGTWPYLVVFLNPDDGATEYAIIDNYFTHPNVPMWGLPNFMYAFTRFDEIEVIPATPCAKEPVSFSIEVSIGTGPEAVARFEWNFGDGTPPLPEDDISQSKFTREHTYPREGTYTVTFTPYRSDGTVVTNKIQIKTVKVGNCVMPVNPNIHLY